ncbi:MAG: peroxiredoxin, partial [Terrimicrobiaceae bacterium]|nr:peroxiredoxin [Terrimicrobiaceae bacterium]
PGCTAQACSLRDAMSELEGRGLRILGVSGDSPEGQKKFKEKHNIPFTLISDKQGEVAKAFGVPTMMGIPARQSFLIKDGKVAWVTTKAKTGDHASEVKEALAKLGG